MKIALLIFSVAILFVCGTVSAVPLDAIDIDVEALNDDVNYLDRTYLRYLSDFKKADVSETEYQMKRQVFKENVEEILRSKNPAFGLTKFSDWTKAEFKAIQGYRRSEEDKGGKKLTEAQFADLIYLNRQSLGTPSTEKNPGMGPSSCTIDMNGVSVAAGTFSTPLVNCTSQYGMWYSQEYGKNAVDVSVPTNFKVYLLDNANYQLYSTSQSFSCINSDCTTERTVNLATLQGQYEKDDTYRLLIECTNSVDACNFTGGVIDIGFSADPLLECAWQKNKIDCGNTTDCSWSQRYGFCLPDDSDATMDWRRWSTIGPVKHQGRCGSCWAFGTVQNAAATWKLAGHPLYNLGEQTLVDCDEDNYACDGGVLSHALDWIAENGVNLESDYPYTASHGYCKYDSATAKVKQDGLRGYYSLPADEDAMEAYVRLYGPLAIAVDSSDFQCYSSGILTCSYWNTNLDHAVQIVGIGGTGPDKYWIVKNSWGDDWGENGYVRIKFGVNSCGIAEDPTQFVICNDCYNKGDCGIFSGKQQCECSEAGLPAGCGIRPYIPSSDDSSRHNFTGCFIATAAYENNFLDERLFLLRSFRDLVLLKSVIGTHLVHFYYATSPPIADFIAQHASLRLIARMLLFPVVSVLSLFTSNYEASLIPISLLALLPVIVMGVGVEEVLRRLRRKA